MSDKVETVIIPPDDNRGTGYLRTLAVSRLAAGFVQGLGLYLLYLSVDDSHWPATDPYWLAPLLLVFVFVPLLFQQAVGTMRTRTLAIWTVAAAILLAALAWYDIWRHWEPQTFNGGSDAATTAALIVSAVVGLFIAQSLIAAADAERRFVASYAAYFDAAWKLEIQLLLAALFVGVFWGVLWLGAVLFNLINLGFVETLIEKSWFAIPATTLAVAAAIHVTDVRARLVAGIRTVAHTLLSWLLPLMVLIAVGFTVSLLFTGLSPLWATKSAAGLLLTSAAVLVILLNAAFQDGDPAHNRSVVLRYAEFAAALVLVPFVLIAAYALWLRVAQYGWTAERIGTAAAILVALCYALGYAVAALLSLRGGIWMVLLERVNIVTAFIVLAVLLALFTPLADPARLSVDSQVTRLTSGAVSPKAFDFYYLRAEGGRYGRAALGELATGEFGASTALIRKLARTELAGVATTIAPTKTDLTANITVYPASRALPHGFVEQDWSRVGGAPACLTAANVKCDAFFGDFDGDGSEDVVLVSPSAYSFWGTIFRRGADRSWTPVATISGNCPGMIDALRGGHATVAPPHAMWRDWVIEGVHLHPTPTASDTEPCRP